MRVNHIEMQHIVYVKIQFDSVNMKLKYIDMKHKWHENIIKNKVHVYTINLYVEDKKNTTIKSYACNTIHIQNRPSAQFLFCFYVRH